VWDQILTNHPGLKLTIAHGQAVLKVHTGAPHQSAAAECDQMVGWLRDLFAEHDGSGGRAMVRLDMASFITFWAEHNDLYQQGVATTHNYRSIMIDYAQHFMLGRDPINLAAVSYQSDGCGAGDNPLEQSYLSARINLEGPYDPANSVIRFLDLVSAGNTLDRIYRLNLFDALAAHGVNQIGPAGVDANQVRRVDCGQAQSYLQMLIDSVHTEHRQTIADTDPLIAALMELANELAITCAAMPQ
jgi:hypothetical protein